MTGCYGRSPRTSLVLVSLVSRKVMRGSFSGGVLSKQQPLLLPLLVTPHEQ
jgi:hypothetical protein